VHNYSSQVIKMTILSTQSRPGNAAHGERGHVERFHRKIHLRVHLRAIGIAPPKSFNVKAQHLERTNTVSAFRLIQSLVQRASYIDRNTRSPLRMRSARRLAKLGRGQKIDKCRRRRRCAQNATSDTESADFYNLTSRRDTRACVRSFVRSFVRHYNSEITFSS